MKCTSCSRVVRPVVAIDIDGTLGNYHGHFWDFARMWLGVPVPDRADIYDGSEPYRDWFCRSYGVDVTTFRNIKLAYRQGGMKRTMPLYPGARELVEELQLVAEVWLTTTRPWERYDRVDPDTREWLRRNRIEYDALLYNENKMDELAGCVDPRRVVAVLDDEQEVLRTAVRRGWGAILRRTDYNRAVEWPSAVGSLKEAELVIMERILNWEGVR